MRKWMMSGLGLCLLLAGQTRPTTQSSGNGFADYSISEPRIQDLKGFTYFHTSRKITIRQMNQVMTAEVQKAVAAARNRINGPLVLTMHGMTANANQPFDIDTGFPVDKGAPAPDGFSVSDVPIKRFATVIYSGPMEQMGLAYRKVYSAIFAGGMMPGDESRQYFLYWEGADSVNNVVMIAVEVQ
jgi:effector-binding domain-containing protein